MSMDAVADTEPHEHEAAAEEHTAADFEVADFRELMTDGPAERREKAGSRHEDGQESLEHGVRRDSFVGGQKRTRESSAAAERAASAPRDDEERMNVQQEIDGDDQGRHVDKRLRTAEPTALQDSSNAMSLPLLTPQQETATNEDDNSKEIMTPSLVDMDHIHTQAQNEDNAGAGGKQETADERKARQREANRLAAGRSRGKKRDELYVSSLNPQPLSPFHPVLSEIMHVY